MLAITRASLRAIFRSPSSVVFGFAFPFIFILVFGFIGNSAGKRVYRVALARDADTSNALYQAFRKSGMVTMIRYGSEDSLQNDLRRGNIAGVIDIRKESGEPAPYTMTLKSTNASADQWPQFKALAESVINQVSDRMYHDRPAYATLDFNEGRDISQIREYKEIDFILPGQLGFSLLAAGVFGVAFMFFNLRNTLVLKRFFATPISRTYIVLGEMLSRVLFQLITAVVIIALGRYFFGFTLIHGVRTFLEMIVLSFIGLIVFMGFGFIVSGIARNDSTIPPLANIITLPQFLIGGTFFSISVFPTWLQWVARIMPLTHLNSALRSIAFEGKSLWDVRQEIGILLIWGVVVYVVAIKVFKWE